MVALGGLAHTIAGTEDALSAPFAGALGIGDYLEWFVEAVIRNAVGGVVIVALLNYAQVRGGDG